MVTIEQLRKAHSEYIKKIEKLKKPLSTMLEKYYNENIVDKNGNTIQKDQIIKDTKSNKLYKVIFRGMLMPFIPEAKYELIICNRISEKNKTMKKKHTFYRNDFVELEIVEETTRKKKRNRKKEII
jgi:hypothetical protein